MNQSAITVLLMVLALSGCASAAHHEATEQFDRGRLMDSSGVPVHADLRESKEKPFWLDRATFEHEGYLFSVGIASSAPTLEDGRAKAFDAAKREMEGAKGAEFVASRQLETADVFEVSHRDGTYSIWRLVTIKLDAPTKGQVKSAAEIAEILRLAEMEESNKTAVDRAIDFLMKNNENVYAIAKALGSSGGEVMSLVLHCEKAKFIKPGPLVGESRNLEIEEIKRKLKNTDEWWEARRDGRLPQLVERELRREQNKRQGHFDKANAACAELVKGWVLAAQAEIKAKEAEIKAKEQARLNSERWDWEHRSLWQRFADWLSGKQPPSSIVR